MTDRWPDLQKLVADHGGYHLITPAAWAEFDRLMLAGRRRLLEGLPPPTARRPPPDRRR